MEVTTKKLYQQDVYLKEWNAKILEVQEEGDFLTLELDQTAFFPEGGGQECDQGALWFAGDLSNMIFMDSDVQEQGEKILHKIKKVDGWEGLVAGAEVSCQLNWQRRFRNMQRHCGEHILSTAFYDLYGGVNRGFHMGDKYMTIDINLEDNPEFTQFTEDMVKQAEWAANCLIWMDLPVRARHFDNREEAAALPMRKKLAIDEDIILVSIGDPDWAPGCVACCGTHPGTTGQVGFIKIYRWESNKGMTRIYFDAGQDALLRYQEDDKLLRSLCKKYSAEPETLDEKIRIQEEKAKQVRQELYELKKVYTEEKVKELLAEAEKGEKVLVHEYQELRVDDLLNMGKKVSESSPVFTALVSPTENTVILSCSGAADCGKLVKDNAGVWNGKGGGRADSARAMFPSRQEMDCFLDFLKVSQAGGR